MEDTTNRIVIDPINVLNTILQFYARIVTPIKKSVVMVLKNNKSQCSF